METDLLSAHLIPVLPKAKRLAKFKFTTGMVQLGVKQVVI